MEDVATASSKKEQQDARHLQPQWPSLSPWKDGKLNGMVRNTFIHSSMPPPTPVIGSLRRSMSLGHTQRHGHDSGNGALRSGGVSERAPQVVKLSRHLTN